MVAPNDFYDARDDLQYEDVPVKADCIHMTDCDCKPAFRYLVFSYTTYYPNGGMTDCVLKTNDVEEAKRRATYEKDERIMHANIYDVITGKYVPYPSEDD